MVENGGKWRCKRKPISKFGLSNGGKGVTTPLAPERWCDSHEVGCHPGNVGQYEVYKGLVERYMTEFFGTKNLDTFRSDEIYKYAAWRKTYFTEGPGSELEFLEITRNGKPYKHKVKHQPVELRSGELATICKPTSTSSRFRFNRRFYSFNAFRSLLGIAGGAEAPTFAELYSGEWQHPTCSGCLR